jgi:hypothetical protein
LHLGRFHATIYDLASHFTAADLPAKLEQCAAALDQYAQGKTAAQLEEFRTGFDTLLKASEVKDPELKQPYALQVISEMALTDILDPDLPVDLHRIVKERAFDHAGIATDFRTLATKITKKSSQVSSIDKAFTDLEVEFERVEDNEAEIGILLPREIVGESLSALTSEFNKLGKLFRAINELTGAPDYDPKVRTISSSWWQVFLELQPTQILVWVIAIERIVALFKSNLEIKVLQQQLSSKEIPKKITELIEKEIDTRVSSALNELAAEIRKEHAKIDDEGRLNEIEIQLRQGFTHLAMRINQGSQVEINVAIPEEPKEPPASAEGEELNQEIQAEIASQQARITELRELCTRSRAASTETLNIDGASRVLLKYFEAGQSKDEVPPV